MSFIMTKECKKYRESVSLNWRIAFEKLLNSFFTLRLNEHGVIKANVVALFGGQICSIPCRTRCFASVDLEK